jgi:DNA-binding XRE family transcriptional regulator
MDMTPPAAATSQLSGRQCRAARAWLGWSQDELAKVAGVDKQTVMHFEIGRREARKATLLALMLVFFRAGIQIDAAGNLVIPR